MKPTLVSLCLIAYLFSSVKAYSAIGTILKLRGNAIRIAKGSKDQIPLAKGSKLEEGDTLVTSKASFIRAKMNDETFFNLGPSSQMSLDKFKFSGDKRETLYNIARGQVRAIINKKAQTDKAVVIQTKNISMGVRGTEFLSNAYMVKGKATSDVVLLKGKVATNISKLNIPQKSFNLQPGQAFNTNKLIADKSLASVKNLSPDVLSSLAKNAESFLPNMQLPNGSFVNMAEAMKAAAKGLSVPSLPVAGVAAGVGAGVGALAGAAVGSASSGGGGSQAAQTAQAPSKIETSSINPNDPWDIRDAQEREEDMKADGKCFYWFYKKLPGGGVPQRYRREEECNEYEYDD